MNFSECLSKVATDRLRGARKLWSSDEWYRSMDRDGSRWMQFLVFLDGRSFGLPGPLVTTSEPDLGPLVLVTVCRQQGSTPPMPGARITTYAPTSRDMLATDWEIVDDARVVDVIKKIQEPPTP